MTPRRPVMTPWTFPVLLAFAVLAMAPGKCQPAPLPEEPLCDGPKDCEGQPHPECVGAWTCTDDATCLWECKTDPPTCEGGCADGQTCECSETCDPAGVCKASCACVPEQTGPACIDDFDCKPGTACVCESACGTGKPAGDALVPCLLECTCQPVTPPGCVSSKECGEGCTCTNGVCQCEPPQMCWADSDCKAGCWCDMSSAPCLIAPCWGQCVCEKPPLGTCTSDTQCAKGESCSTASGDCLPCADCPACAVCCGTCEADPQPSSCVVTGCSGQLCAPQDMFTTCEWKPVYACYKLAKCGPDSSGACGWSGGADFEECLKSGGM